MTDEAVPVTVHIMDKEYKVACPPGQQQDLLASAQHLDQKMREIRDSGRVVGVERIAVMAALNITHELLEQADQGDGMHLSERLESLADRVDVALDQNHQLKF